MTLWHCAAAAAGLLALLGAEARAQPLPNDSALAVPQIVDVQGGQVRVVPVATGLVHPWSLAFLPDERTLLVAERSGRLRIIRDGVLAPEPVWTAPAPTPARDAPAGLDDRLKWIALHPRFAENRLVYLSHPVSGERGSSLAVARGR
jgi:glucose/arabinose dehydrogenase